jgi:hypothetical protein
VSAAAESPPTLDQLLTQAMDNNPGILAEKAKVAMAEAELRRVRFDVARQLVACWNDIKAQEQAVASARVRFTRAADLTKSRATAHEDLDAAKEALIAAEGKLAAARSELQFLTGQGPPAVSARGHLYLNVTSGTPRPPLQVPHGPMVEKIRKALSTPARIEFFATPVNAVADYLKGSQQIEVQVDHESLGDKMPTITLDMSGASLAATLQAVDDKFHGLKFVVRDYGILVTTPERAQEAGYMPVVEFARLFPPEQVSEPRAAKEAAQKKHELPHPLPRKTDPFAK